MYALIYESARAKINLTLDVIAKRTDGFHEVEMVMQTVDLCDYLTMTERDDEQIAVTTNAAFVPTDERNLAYKAALLLREATGVRKGALIDIDKRIPVAAGLAGGSADAAAALRGLNRLWNTRLSHDELAEIGARIGSDVPFCIYGGTAIARGRGEKIERLPSAPCYFVVLVKPAISVSTADIYGALRLDRIVEHPSARKMTEALSTRDLDRVVLAAGNVLEPITTEIHPEVARIKEQLLRMGAVFAQMSGSGPTVFGLTTREQKAKRIAMEFKTWIKEVYLCRTC